MGVDWGLMSALETLFIIPVVLVTFALQNQLLRGVRLRSSEMSCSSSDTMVQPSADNYHRGDSSLRRMLPADSSAPSGASGSHPVG